MPGSIPQQNSITSNLLRHLQQIVTAELHWLLDQLAPRHCPLCLSPLKPSAPSTELSAPVAQLLCSDCNTKLRQSAAFCCPCCDEPYMTSSATNHICSRCLHEPAPFLWLKTATLYNDTVAQATQKFKYQGKVTLAAALAQFMLQQLSQDIRKFSPQILVPVPLHSTRLRHRGYNQSLLLTRVLARQLEVPIAVNVLKRIRATSSQTQLNAHQRWHNLRKAFEIGEHLAPQRILLVDDIVTTTATARACATVLRQQGHSVAVVALGRATLT